jgi:hypothetical protein
MLRPLAALFACALVAGCGNDGSPPSSGGITPPSPPPAAQNFSLRFFGTGANDVDRVKIPLLNANATERAVNIGATDLTLEFWIKGARADNPTAACTTGPIGRDAWINGAIVIDRDVFGDGDFGDYGIALFAGQVAFGVSRAGSGQTLCGARDVLDGAWHHVAVTRQRATGALRIFVDGAVDASATDPTTSLDVRYNPAHANPAANDPFLVLGAEKHSLAGFVSFNGSIDELRLSTLPRYLSTFSRPTGAFVPDGDTAALYHFDESSGTAIVDAANNNGSPGELRPASAMANHRSTDTPF